MCTINDNPMMYGSWDIERDRQIFFSIWIVFCPFTPLKTWKIKILKKWKKHLQISSFYTRVPKIRIICYTVPEIWCRTDVIVIGLFFDLLSRPTAWKMKISKKMKKSIQCHNFTQVYQKLWLYGILFLRHGTSQM